MKEGWIDFFKDYRVILLAVLIIVSIGSISVYGIQQGLDLQEVPSSRYTLINQLIKLP